MNWVILNGVKSTKVKGLMIQSLPPISKPLIRTEQVEIDGRDGDITRKLGYSAYDKEMEIGLFADFNIDDVISYFDSEGTVTFSNEPGKYYRYQILEQIDFERLIRFRTATVTFHVQPFKFSTVGEVVAADIDQFGGLQKFSKTKNGITVSTSDNSVQITGQGSSGYTEFYIPINATELQSGAYTLYSYMNGLSSAGTIMARLIQSAPTDADSFGSTYFGFQSGAQTEFGATLGSSATYNFIWLYIAAGVSLDETITFNLLKNNVVSKSLLNLGNTYSKPTYKITGSGAIQLYVNGNSALELNLGINQSLTVDVEEMNAYNDVQLLNRQIIGDYENMMLAPGSNSVSWEGTIFSFEATDISRWI